MESTESGSASGSAESVAGLGVTGIGLGSTAFGVGFCTIAAGLGEAEIHAPDAQRSRTTACCAIASEPDARVNRKTLALAAHCPCHRHFWSVANSICRTFVGIRILELYSRKQRSVQDICISPLRAEISGSMMHFCHWRNTLLDACKRQSYRSCRRCKPRL